MLDGKVETVVRRNALIPLQESWMFQTSRENQTSVVFPVYEGEGGLTSGNNLLDKFTLVTFPRLLRESGSSR